MLDIHIDHDSHLAVLTMNRPEARNAINGELALRIEAAIDQVEADDAIWVTILTGVAPVFCAGADLREIQAGREPELSTERGGFAGIVRRERRKPIIAAVEGVAVAGGLEIVLSCDLVVAAESARFGVPEVKRALVAAAGGMFRLGRLVPRNIALELLMTGDVIDANRAYEIGLVSEVVEAGHAVEAATALAARITANAPLAVQLSRSVALETMGAPDATGWARSREAMDEVLATDDNAEGVAAFLEKRSPVWTGK